MLPSLRRSPHILVALMPRASAGPMSLRLAPAAADQTATARAPNRPVLPTHASCAARASLMPACEMLQEPAGHSVQFSHSVMSNSCDPMDCSMPGFPVHHQLPKYAQTHVHRVGDGIQPSHPLVSLLLLPSILPSVRVFSSESLLHMRWPKY